MVPGPAVGTHDHLGPEIARVPSSQPLKRAGGHELEVIEVGVNALDAHGGLVAAMTRDLMWTDKARLATRSGPPLASGQCVPCAFEADGWWTPPMDATKSRMC
jgi:hypothetical protein